MTHRLVKALTLLICLLIGIYYLIFLLSVEEFDDSIAVGWLNRSSSCECQGEPNCYPHPANPNLCGKCFNCHHNRIASSRRKEQLVFAFSSKDTKMNRILVLVASIHSHHPTTKILIYDMNLSPSSTLKKQLISIRNVQVISPSEMMEDSSVIVHESQMVPHQMKDSLTYADIVIWLNDELELLSDELVPIAKRADTGITTIGRETTQTVEKLGFSTYFPTYSVNARNHTLLIIKGNAKTDIDWMVKCASQSDCWDCRSAAGSIVDCTPFLLARLSVDNTNIGYQILPSKSIQHQRWEPPYCDAKCIAYTVAGVLIALIVTVVTVLVMFSRMTQKKK